MAIEKRKASKSRLAKAKGGYALTEDLDAVIDHINDNIMPSDGTLKADTISENTSGSGVTVDGVALKDGGITLTKATVTQATSITTGVEINAKCGIITTVTPNITAGTTVAFDMTNDQILADSVVLITADVGSIVPGTDKPTFLYSPYEGGCSIVIENRGAGAFTTAIKFNFLVL